MVHSSRGGPFLIVILLLFMLKTSFILIRDRVKVIKQIKQTKVQKIYTSEPGFVEFEGRAKANSNGVLISPFSGKECCFYEAQVCLYDDKPNVVYRSEEPFLLSDDTGECLIIPAEAELTGKHFVVEKVTKINRQDPRTKAALRVTELRIPVGHALFIDGFCKLNPEAQGPKFVISAAANDVAIPVSPLRKFIISSQNKLTTLNSSFYSLLFWLSIFVMSSASSVVAAYFTYRYFVYGLIQ